jgi:hypothetical protein
MLAHACAYRRMNAGESVIKLGGGVMRRTAYAITCDDSLTIPTAMISRGRQCKASCNRL